MKYAAYNEYKTSPMMWLDRLPIHWNAASLRWMSKRYAGGTPDKGNEAYWEGGDIPWINSGAVNDGYITQPSELITREGFANSSAKWIPKDALVMALAGQGKTKGMVAQLGIPTTCNQSMAALIPDHRFAPRYLYYWFTANYQNIRNLAGGEARDGLNLEMLGSIPCPVPPIDEQQTIARFLDAKTAQVDVLMAQKRKLIDKLKEKRSALIACTVTRGLPPESAKAAGLEPVPPLKDSGVIWLGEVPAHWTCAKTAFFFSAGMGQTILKEELTDDGIPVYSATEGDHFFGRLMDPSLRLKRGDIVVPARGNSIGHVKLVREESTCTQTTIYFKNRVQSRIDSEFAFFFMKGLRHHLFKFDQTAIPQITVDQVLGNPMLVPPMSEQLAICKFLRDKEAGTSRMIQMVELAIDRLAEYRQALINSVVAGKIDVRRLA
jgi:type I restriction enzyme S subunit